MFRNEVAFRRRIRPPILESVVVDAANTAVDEHGLNEWMKTSVAQLHLFRTGLRPYVPALIGAASNDTQVSEEMSPAEAGFVILYLYQGKLREPEYQVAPEVWVQWWTKREAQFSRETSVLAEAIHRFLDDAGFSD